MCPLATRSVPVKTVSHYQAVHINLINIFMREVKHFNYITGKLPGPSTWKVQYADGTICSTRLEKTAYYQYELGNSRCFRVYCEEGL